MEIQQSKPKKTAVCLYCRNIVNLDDDGNWLDEYIECNFCGSFFKNDNWVGGNY